MESAIGSWNKWWANTVRVDHSTTYRWFQRYAPELEKRLRWQCCCPQSTSWRVDETYVKVRGACTHLYRALDKHGKHNRFLSLADRKRQSRETLPGKGAERFKGLGKAEGHQHGQGADLQYWHFRVESRRQMSRERSTSTGQILQRGPPCRMPIRHRRLCAHGSRRGL
jgi:hypothetical protein